MRRNHSPLCVADHKVFKQLLATTGPPTQDVSASLANPNNPRCDLSEVLVLDPCNIAEQLALEGHQLYRGVKLAECLKVEIVHEMNGSFAPIFTMRTKVRTSFSQSQGLNLNIQPN